MTKEEGVREIEGAPWGRDDDGYSLDMRVHDKDGHEVHAWLAMRPVYCDRGHIQLNIHGALGLDEADSFPRYFFSFSEADAHTRMFLKWRLWKQRTVPDAAIKGAFAAELWKEVKERES